MFIEECAEDPDSDGTSDPLRDNQPPSNGLPAVPQPQVPSTPSPREDITRPSKQLVAQLAGSSPDERRTISSISISPNPASGPSPLPSVSTWADISPSLSSLSPRQNSTAPMTTREAFLLRSFIQTLSPRVRFL